MKDPDPIPCPRKPPPNEAAEDPNIPENKIDSVQLKNLRKKVKQKSQVKFVFNVYCRYICTAALFPPRTFFNKIGVKTNLKESKKEINFYLT
jgi:hypothetical protein